MTFRIYWMYWLQFIWIMKYCISKRVKQSANCKVALLKQIIWFNCKQQDQDDIHCFKGRPNISATRSLNNNVGNKAEAKIVPCLSFFFFLSMLWLLLVVYKHKEMKDYRLGMTSSHFYMELNLKRTKTWSKTSFYGHVHCWPIWQQRFPLIHLLFLLHSSVELWWYYPFYLVLMM